MNEYSNWITLSEQYLKTSKLIMEQIITHENKWFMIDNKPIEWDRYFEETKWSDFNTFVPSLFLMIHGLELLLKGMVIWSGNTISYNHSSSELIYILAHDERINPKFIKIVSNYIGGNPSNKIIVDFLQLNTSISKNNLHCNIRYPENKTEVINFSPMRYKEKDIIEHIKIIIRDVEELYRYALEIVRGS